MKSFIQRFIMSVLAVIVLQVTFASLPATAQDNGPDGYCIPKQWFTDNYIGGKYSAYYYCYPDYPKMYPSSYLDASGASITYVKITPKNNPSEIILYRQTGDDYNGSDTYCYAYMSNDYDGTGQFTPGDQYNIEIGVKAHSWEYSWGYSQCDYSSSWANTVISCRMFFDWTRDGDWLDVAPAAEYVQWWDCRISGNYCLSNTFTGSFTVPADVDPGKTRIRITAASNGYSLLPTSNRQDPCKTDQFYSYDYGSYGYAYGYQYGETEDYLVEFIIPIKGTFPEAGSVLFAQRDYDGTPKEIDEVMEQFPRPMLELRDPAPAGTKVTYRIRGPLPSKDLVYTGLDKNGNEQFDLSKPFSTKTPKIFEFYKSTGTYTTGAGEVNFTKSGEYYVELELYQPGKTTPKFMTKRFTVSWANDLSIQTIANPMKCYITDSKPFLKRYARGNIPFAISVKNTGKKTIYRFDLMYDVYKAVPMYDGTKVIDYKRGDLLHSDTIHYDTTQAGMFPLVAKASTTIDFGMYPFYELGKYIMVAKAVLLNGTDEETFNDVYPRTVFLSGEPDVWPYGSSPKFMFEVADEIEAQAISSIVPGDGGRLVVNRPFFPTAELQNNGVADISNSTAKLIFQHKTKKDYKKEIQMVVASIPQGLYNRKTVKFPAASLKYPGEYAGWLIIKAEGDLVPKNDTITFSFTVDQGIQGKFFVGKGQDYNTIQEAMDDLYYYGMEGSIELVLTDKFYDVYAPDAYSPAWDFSTTIVGLGLQEDGKTINTLSVKPSDERAVARGGVTVRLHSSNGRGIFFGQSIVNNSKKALIREELTGNQYRIYANSPGYINFDGGKNKTLKFELYSASKNHGSVFYLNRGSQNISIKNCLMNNETPELRDKVYIPHVSHSDADGFYFESDTAFTQTGIDGYSAGVASRGTLFDELVVRFDSEGNVIPPGGPEDQGQRRKIVLDTIPNMNNQFSNNEIKGFGYGFVNLGTGALFNGRIAKYSRYYNKNNVIENNIISDVSRAGVLAGYEENLTIKGNTIYTVRGTGTDDRGDLCGIGIQIGTPSRGRFKGYNSLNVTVQGNSIQDVRGLDMVNGIRVEQGHSRFTDPSSGFITFPDAPDNIRLYSNAIWNIKPLSASTERVGINYFTERKEDSKYDEYTQLTTPLYPELLLVGAEICNNTILFDEDGFDNKGKYFGIGIQQAVGVLFANNAISMEDNTSNAATVRSALFLQGKEPKKGFIKSDRNAYWTGTSGADVVRFVESIPMMVNNKLTTGFLHTGFNGEYKELRQWRNWTGMDINSVANKNFMSDYAFVGIPAKLEMKKPLPMASVLNNRGQRLSGKHYDIYGTERGASDERFDIGAIEFNGEMYKLDNEIVEIMAPATYRETFGKFSGAEYVMTDAPVDVTSILRNNGSLLQSSIPVNVKIERDDNGTLHNVLEEKVFVNAPAYGDALVNFNLADGVGKEFVPQSFAELDLPVDDATFYGMEESVTPVYTITITASDDENNVNNVSVKKVRFYIMTSGIKLLECNSMLNADYATSGNAGILASNLNAKAIEDGLRSISYYNVSRKQAEQNVLDGLTKDLAYSQVVDRFNRNSWPERSLDFSTYRSLIWTDGNEEQLTRYTALAVKDYLLSGTENEKKNFLVGSQEIIRNNMSLDMDYNFNAEIFHAKTRAPHSPLGIDVSSQYVNYDKNTVTGVNVERMLQESVRSTVVAGDNYPQPGLFDMVAGDGITRIAYIYDNVSTGANATEAQRIMGLAHSQTDRNVLLYGVEWRHFGDIESVLRASFDFVEKNGGQIVPIDLYTFGAQQNGLSVELLWSTASENNASHFVVERKLSGTDKFESIAEVKAVGTSSVVNHYTLTDAKVSLGNTYIYKLKLVDADGSSNYSNDVTVELEGIGGILTVGDVTPNPVKDQSTVSVNLSESATMTVELFNSEGKSLGTLFNGTTTGLRDITINAQDYATGSYTLVFRVGERTIIRSIRIVK